MLNSADEYVRTLSLAKLLTSEPTLTVREIMASNISAIHVSETDTAMAKIFSVRDLISAQTVDDEGLLVARITVDEVIDVIIEDAEEAVLAQAGLDEDEDTFAPVHKAVRRRAEWLEINPLTALMAADIIHLLKDAIVKVVAFVVIRPVAASMGEIAGTQTYFNH